jgi:hypothetical protein
MLGFILKAFLLFYQDLQVMGLADQVGIPLLVLCLILCLMVLAILEMACWIWEILIQWILEKLRASRLIEDPALRRSRGLGRRRGGETQRAAIAWPGEGEAASSRIAGRDRG